MESLRHRPKQIEKRGGAQESNAENKRNLGQTERRKGEEKEERTEEKHPQRSERGYTSIRTRCYKKRVKQRVKQKTGK